MNPSDPTELPVSVEIDHDTTILRDRLLVIGLVLLYSKSISRFMEHQRNQRLN